MSDAESRKVGVPADEWLKTAAQRDSKALVEAALDMLNTALADAIKNGLKFNLPSSVNKVELVWRTD